jgi:hypothetical protein
MTMLLDTGSSDTWVLSYKANLCTDQELQDLYGMTCTDTYDPSKSSTNKLVTPHGFKIVYLDGGTASGDYISDDFSIGGTTIKSLQMAYVTQAVRGTGIMGLGFSSGERASTKYPNIMDELTNQGKISCKAYSLYLNDRRTDAGSILFGGIDTDKFIGPLKILPLYKPQGGDDDNDYSSFEVNFTAVSLAHTNGTASVDMQTSILDHPVPAVLDSGTTLSYLPDEITSRLYSALGAVFDPDLRMTLIDCGYLTSDTGLKLMFTFPSSTGEARISVPVWELVLDILPPSSASSAATAHFKSGPCVFGIQSTAVIEDAGGLNFTLLGDTFLRSAYVVYDLTHHQIGIAQANLNSTGQTIIELSAQGSSLPTGVTGVAAQQTTFTPTGLLRTASPSPTPSNASKNSAPGRKGKGTLREVVGVLAATGLCTLLGGALISW